jgi:hypothetical protein
LLPRQLTCESFRAAHGSPIEQLNCHAVPGENDAREERPIRAECRRSVGRPEF